jgi:hypothetical protein
MEQYVAGITLGFPTNGFVGCIAARIEADIAKKHNELHAGGGRSRKLSWSSDDSDHVAHVERPTEMQAEAGADFAAQE